jgi:hypothetical protein
MIRSKGEVKLRSLLPRQKRLLDEGDYSRISLPPETLESSFLFRELMVGRVYPRECEHL